MKAIGMTLIVYGHVAHATTVPLTPPIYLKQLGVALFLFATGFTLAGERRPTVDVLFGRMFQIWLFGLSLAALLTAKGLMTGTGLALSNFLPFLAGANVIFNNFPANPTTWYLGTYLHALLLWGVWLRRGRVRLWMVAVAVAVEIPVRALLIAWAGPFVAYMLLTNWIAVFLLGMVCGAREDAVRLQGTPVPYAAALTAVLIVWGTAMRWVGFEATFPFMSVDRWPAPVGLAVVSAGVSCLYLGVTWLVFEATRRVDAALPVSFIARNTPIIFLAHMPVFLALHPVLAGWGLGYWARVAVDLLVCLPGLAVVSELIRAAVRPDRLRQRVFETFVLRRPVLTHAGAQLPS